MALDQPSSGKHLVLGIKYQNIEIIISISILVGSIQSNFVKIRICQRGSHKSSMRSPPSRHKQSFLE